MENLLGLELFLHSCFKRFHLLCIIQHLPTHTHTHSISDGGSRSIHFISILLAFQAAFGDLFGERQKDVRAVNFVSGIQRQIHVNQSGGVWFGNPQRILQAVAEL